MTNTNYPLKDLANVTKFCKSGHNAGVSVNVLGIIAMIV